ncbi:MAG TPA: PH domain-containing protein [Candidatus Saccharimonadales bacterium]|nr:PH domain-containing protein [Candidatus Saccharimonadales bacterium]
MPISPQQDKYLHSKLPIDEDEKILAVYKHHWFAYASSWIVAVIVVIMVMSIAIAFTVLGTGGSDGVSTGAQHQNLILAVAGGFSALILVGAALPVYLRSQESLILTEEALVQMLQPSLFASSVNQLSLQHITDVSVTQDFFGTTLGFGHLNIETPGEQNNYNFMMLPDPHTAARQIIQAHENFDAALQGGMLPSTLGAARQAQVQTQQAPAIDPQQYQQFLQYQQMVAQQQAQSQQAAQSNDPTQSSPTQSKEQ